MPTALALAHKKPHQETHTALVYETATQDDEKTASDKSGSCCRSHITTLTGAGPRLKEVGSDMEVLGADQRTGACTALV